MPISLESPIEEKIAWARRQYQMYEEALLRDPGIAGLLTDLEAAINASHEEMMGTGMAAICRRCDQEEGGSCCGAGIEDRYDAWLLLINLLLGATLPEKPCQSDACFFSGETGCLLRARHVLCINYLCKKATDQIDPGRLSRLREKEGVEVNALFILHERIKTVLKKWMSDSETPLPR